MNLFSGYREFTLNDGKTIELKFCNGSTEIYADLMGLKTLDEIDQSLIPAVAETPIEGKSEAEQAEPKVIYTANYLKALRLYVYAAALYVCRIKGKTPDFNEWTPVEWIEEITTQQILAAVDTYEADAVKKNEVVAQMVSQ